MAEVARPTVYLNVSVRSLGLPGILRNRLRLSALAAEFERQASASTMVGDAYVSPADRKIFVLDHPKNTFTLDEPFSRQLKDAGITLLKLPQGSPGYLYQELSRALLASTLPDAVRTLYDLNIQVMASGIEPDFSWRGLVNAAERGNAGWFSPGALKDYMAVRHSISRQEFLRILSALSFRAATVRKYPGADSVWPVCTPQTFHVPDIEGAVAVMKDFGDIISLSRLLHNNNPTLSGAVRLHLIMCEKDLAGALDIAYKVSATAEMYALLIIKHTPQTHPLGYMRDDTGTETFIETGKTWGEADFLFAAGILDKIPSWKRKDTLKELEELHGSFFAGLNKVLLTRALRISGSTSQPPSSPTP